MLLFIWDDSKNGVKKMKNFIMEHLTLREYPSNYNKESGEFTLDDNLVYDEIKGLWVLKDTGEIMVKSGRKDIPVSGTKKNDIEIGEDQKAAL